MSFLSKLLPKRAPAAAKLDYEQLVLLDAEDLAEQGIREAYERLLPELRKYVSSPAEVEEEIDPDTASYSVRCAGFEFVVYAPTLPGTDAESWGRATYAFFTMVNEQLSGSNMRFYALNGGNDLGGMFLSPEAATASRAGLPRKADWPYIPQLEYPYYGQHH
jgi:hypothetical protein